MVSIILCTYNRFHLLPRAISSVLNQAYSNWELIVVDDGSNDGTGSLVRRMCRTDRRIHYLYQKNKGLSEARNTGLLHAAGDLICFLDSDDEIAPDHLERRVNYLERNLSVDLLHGGAKLIGPNSKRYVVDLTDPAKKIHLRHCHIGGTFFFRRKILTRVKKFKSLPFGEDFDFYTRVAEHFTVKKVRYATYLYHLETENRLCDLFTEKLFKMKKAEPS